MAQGTQAATYLQVLTRHCYQNHCTAFKVVVSGRFGGREELGCPQKLDERCLPWVAVWHAPASPQGLAKRSY
jgi:hypothetical protein